jgi:hypothetical protein
MFQVTADLGGGMVTVRFMKKVGNHYVWPHPANINKGPQAGHIWAKWVQQGTLFAHAVPSFTISETQLFPFTTWVAYGFARLLPEQYGRSNYFPYGVGHCTGVLGFYPNFTAENFFFAQ